MKSASPGLYWAVGGKGLVQCQRCPPDATRVQYVLRAFVDSAAGHCVTLGTWAGVGRLGGGGGGGISDILGGCHQMC